MFFRPQQVPNVDVRDLAGHAVQGPPQQQLPGVVVRDDGGRHRAVQPLQRGRLKENAKADARQTICEEYDELREVYDRHIWEDKVERTFQFMFERYPGQVPLRSL
jgi:hypothetical protein